MPLVRLCAIASLLLTACGDPPPIGMRRDAGDVDMDTADGSDRDGSTPDGSAPDGSTADGSVGDGGSDADGGTDEILGEGEQEEERCDGEFESVDDDRDLRIDEGCPCVVGNRVGCYSGPPGTQGVGVCHAGVQVCNSMGATATWGECMDMVKPGEEIADNGFDDDCDALIDEDKSICLAEEPAGEVSCAEGRDNDCDGMIDCDDNDCSMHPNCESLCMMGPERNCTDGFDQDCDGRFDCNDSDCATDPTCIEEMARCPPGQTPVYTEQNHGRGRGASSISRGNGRPQWEYMECGTSPCFQGQAYVQSRSGGGTCVEPPDFECPPGQFHGYQGSGRWNCEGPCDYLIEYGGIFDNEIHCAERPMISCPSGQVPTYDYDTQVWLCRRTCNNGLYDRITIDGQLLCIPC